jgi:hypothetical protein
MTTADLLKRVAESPAVGQAVNAEEQRIHEQRVEAAAELERIRALRVDEARTLAEAVETANKAREAAAHHWRAMVNEHLEAVRRQYCASIHFDDAESKQEGILRASAPLELNELLQIVARIESDARASFRSRTVSEVRFAENGEFAKVFGPRGEIRKPVNNLEKVNAILAKCKAVREDVEGLALSALPKADVLERVAVLRELLAD